MASPACFQPVPFPSRRCRANDDLFPCRIAWMAGIFVVTGIAHTTAASELTASDVEYLKTIAGFQSPRFLRDMTPAETSCMHELINRPGDENERSRVVSAFVGWIVLGQVSGDRTPPQTCPPE